MLDDFIKKYDGKGIDFDGAYGNQCMDLYRQYVKEVLGAPQSPSVTGAKDVWTKYLPEYFDKISNTPTGVPQKGDIIIWGTQVGAYGHIAVFISGNSSSFTSFDQNWPVGSVCHKQAHDYKGVLGWLRSKKGSELNMVYDLFRTPDGAVYERLNNYALVYIPNPEFLKKYYGSNPTIQDVPNLDGIGWIAEDPRPLKEANATCVASLNACNAKPPVIVEKPVETILEVDKPDTLEKITQMEKEASTAQIKIDGLMKQKRDLLGELGNYEKKYWLIKKDWFLNIISKFKKEGK